MSIVNNISKIAAAAAGASLVAMSFAPAAFAQTTTTTSTSTSNVSSLQAQIAALQAQLAAAQGTTMTAGASASFTRDLTMGSKGSDVTALQNWLIAKGYSIPAGATGYFGAQTKAALAAYQAANGISPAAGYFGPKTRAAVSMTGGTTTTTGGTTTTTGGTTTLSGTEGSIDNLKVLGSPSNATIYQGQSQNVYGFSFQADGSDLNVNRVDFDVVNNGTVVNGGSGQDRPWSVLQTATLYDGSTVVGTVDASNSSNWSQDGTSGSNHQIYRLRFDGLNDVVKMGTVHTFTVAFTAQNGISTANQTQYTVNLTAQGVRAVDASGIQQYSSSSAANTQIFSVSNAAASTVIFSTASDNPQTSTVNANQTAATQNVTLGSFTVQSQNASSMLYTLPVTLVVSNLAPGISPVQDLKLVANGQVLDSESITSATSYTSTTLNGAAASSTAITFKNMTFTIPAGTTQEFQIQADINPVGGSSTSNAGEGSFAQVTIPTFTGTDIEQSNNRVTPTGGFTGNTITFHTNGLSADATPTTSAVVNGVGTSGSQTGTLNFTFHVTAFGQDIYLGTTSAAYTFNFVGGTGTGTTTITSTADKSADGNYVIHAGQSKQVVISGTTAGANAYVYATLTKIFYGLSDSFTAPTSYSISLPTTYQTQQIYVHS